MSDEDHASAGAQAAPTALLHPWRPSVWASEDRRTRDARGSSAAGVSCASAETAASWRVLAP